MERDESDNEHDDDLYERPSPSSSGPQASSGSDNMNVETEESAESPPINFNLLDLPSTSADIRVYPHAAEVLREEREKQARAREEGTEPEAEEEPSASERGDFSQFDLTMLDLDDEAEDEDESDSEIAARERAFTNGNDWRFKIPFNKDGSFTYCKDISAKGNWSLSSCKSGAPFPFARGSAQHFDGYGIDELLDDDVEKYWQSDGPQPHTVLIEFDQKVDLSFIMLYLDFKNDESYTPSKIVVQLGNSLMHLDEGREFDFNEPVGWQAIDLRDFNERPARTWVILLQVVQNHQNGRDTHIRHIRLASPIKPQYDPVERMQQAGPSNVRSTDSSPDPFRDEEAQAFNKRFMNSVNIR